VNHLTEDQLSAYVDGALPPAEHAAAAAHLAGCEACRASLETMRAADALFGEVLTHDPGDAYFRSFASRVADRIGAEGAGEAAPATARETAPEVLGTERRPPRTGAPWWDLSSWFTAPARLAWVGGVAAVVVVAGVVLMLSREGGVPDLRDAKVLRRGAQTGTRSAAPPAASAPSAESNEAAPEADLAPGAGAGAGGRSQDDAAAQRLSAPSRVREMRQLPGREEAPAGRPDVPGFAREPAPKPPPPAPGEEVKIQRPRRAEPLDATAPGAKAKDEAQAPAPAPAPAPATLEKRATSNLGATGARETEGLAQPFRFTAPGACGVVVDAQGRPIARAQVVLGASGTTATTGDDGRFCFDVATGDYDLTIFAVGFTPLRRTVRLGDPKTPVRLVAQTVEVLPPPGTPPPGAPPAGVPAPPPGVAGELAPVPPAPADLTAEVRQDWNDARRLMLEAAADPDPGRYEAAVEVWNDVVAALPDGPADLEASEHRADALYAAWVVEPNGARAAAASAALRDLVPRLPEGPRRDRVRRLLARLAP